MHILTRCDNCNCVIYDGDRFYTAEVGNSILTFCDRCCESHPEHGALIDRDELMDRAAAGIKRLSDELDKEKLSPYKRELYTYSISRNKDFITCLRGCKVIDRPNRK